MARVSTKKYRNLSTAVKIGEEIYWMKPNSLCLLLRQSKIPSKKNSKQLLWNAKSKRSYIIPSSEYKKWEDKAINHVAIWMQEQRLRHQIVFPLTHCAISIIIWFGDRRRADLSNKVESINDLLVRCKVISDDSWQVVHSLTAEGRYDKEDPRCEIYISQPSV